MRLYLCPSDLLFQGYGFYFLSDLDSYHLKAHLQVAKGVNARMEKKLENVQIQNKKIDFSIVAAHYPYRSLS